MKLQKLAMGIICSTLALSAGSVFADTPPDSSLKMSQILQKIQQEGYSIIKNIEFEGKRYEAKVIKHDGSDVKLELSEGGDIIAPKNEERNFTMVEAVQKVEAAGYKNIYKISASKDKYEMKGYDKNNKKVSLDVDAKTGKIKE